MTLDSMDGLLQPFVDGELTDEECKAVATYLERNPDARQLVREQQAVKAALRDLELERAPAALRARVLVELDAVDEEGTDAANGERDGAVRDIRSGQRRRSGVWGRFGALAKGGLLMVPAAAAAVTLFFVARSDAPGLQGLSGISGTHMNGEVALHLPKTTSGLSGTDAPTVDRALSKANEAEADAKRRLGVDPALVHFPIQVADRPALPPNVELVSDHDQNALATQATVQYTNRNAGLRILDRQRPADDGALPGTPQVFRGHAYHLSRDAHRQPRVDFDHGGVRHRLTFAGEAPPGPSDEVDVDQRDFTVLLELAHALRGR